MEFLVRHQSARGTPLSQTPFAAAVHVLERATTGSGKQRSAQAQQKSSGWMPMSMWPKFPSVRPDPSDDLEILLASYPEISVGTSRSTVEIYDLKSSPVKVEEMWHRDDMSEIMPDGVARATPIAVPPKEYDASLEAVRREVRSMKIGNLSDYWDVSRAAKGAR
ncbi:hypothetical protein DOTSEDRAFT_71569 [Dothistroma septosporum NZE10]|uniref:Uncharacterized protein n=1 Tax=Dothistroma septosporum (strain NZE10 / CBS 128990) TaxID=675120 RepID=N1PN13_DOTSN|nr:hypothetical protein DOTSEDRAFT_71569 [Dothistroma septosporum NZE10]